MKKAFQKVAGGVARNPVATGTSALSVILAALLAFSGSVVEQVNHTDCQAEFDAIKIKYKADCDTSLARLRAEYKQLMMSNELRIKHGLEPIWEY